MPFRESELLLLNTLKTVLSSSSSSSLSSSSAPRKEVVILISSGWALVLVYVITILATFFPLDIRNLAWSQNLSRLTVDAGSLALVGLVLVRYGSYLRSLDMGESRSRASSTGRLRTIVQRSAADHSSSPRTGVAARASNQDSTPNQAYQEVYQRDAPIDDAASSDALDLASPTEPLVQDPASPPAASESKSVDSPSRRRRSGSSSRVSGSGRSSRSSSSSNSSSHRSSSKGSVRKPPQPHGDLLPPDPITRERKGLERNNWLVRRLAIAGAIGMALLIPLQIVIFLRGVANIDLQVTQATVQERNRFQQLETALQDAPAQQIRQGWFQFKQLDPLSEPSNLPSPAQQLDDLIGEATRARDTSLQNLQRQANNARFELGRDTLRVILAALVFAWAFWAFFRPA